MPGPSSVAWMSLRGRSCFTQVPGPAFPATSATGSQPGVHLIQLPQYRGLPPQQTTSNSWLPLFLKPPSLYPGLQILAYPVTSLADSCWMPSGRHPLPSR